MFIFKQKSIENFSLNANFFIGHKVNSKGSINVEDDIYIDGTFEGEIATSGLVEIGKNATVTANINSRALIVEGKFSGKAKIKEEVILIRGSNSSAELIAGEFEVQRGAIINGKMETTS